MEDKLARDLKAGDILYIHRPIKANSELGQTLLNRIKMSREELDRFHGRSLLWRVTKIEPFTWGVNLAGYTPTVAYRITFITTSPGSVVRVEEYFPNNAVGTCM